MIGPVLPYALTGAFLLLLGGALLAMAHRAVGHDPRRRPWLVLILILEVVFVVTIVDFLVHLVGTLT